MPLLKTLSSSLLVVYDISDARKRRCLFKLLKSYGVALQESVFYCELDSQKTRQSLTTVLRDITLHENERIHCFLVNREQAAALSPSAITPLSWVAE